ncbi:SRPBCC domain-containing protein [Devosia sp. XK-2]|uniref:SRPBCC family protein n=1 Tax=Devosia sp. XK-2 TaxID=3126689 RepID=UPI0030CD4CAE
MPDILHRVAMKSPNAEASYKALASIGGLADWWTKETEGESVVGGQIRFTFGQKGFFLMRVLDLVPGRKVLWEVIDGPEEWIGTKVRFEIDQQDDYTVVLFKHEGWREPVEFMHHCSTKWAMFLMSLKSLVETGKGQPAPGDVKIDNWN